MGLSFEERFGNVAPLWETPQPPLTHARHHPPRERRLRVTAFPALSRTDNSEAGLRLRISFLFWLTIAQTTEILHPFECVLEAPRHS